MLLLLSLIILGPTAIIFLLILGALGSIKESWDRWVLKQFKKQPQKVTDIKDINNSFIVKVANFLYPV